MKSKLTFFLFLLNLFACSTVNAYYVAGGEITYRWLGGNTYHIVFTLYNDCAGGTAPPTSLSVHLASSCGDNFNEVARMIAGTDTVTLVSCPGALTTCNGGTSPGIQKWQYYLDYTLPHQCSDWKFSYSLGGWDPAITTINAPGFQNMYVEAHLNDTLFNHDSPVFISDPELFFCDTTSNIDCSAVDPCDSIVYSIACPKNASGTCVSYLTPFDSINFMNASTSLDAQTGMFTIHPAANETQVGVYAVLVEQYRSGVLIGSIVRDIIICITVCQNAANALPQISGINGTNQYSATFAANKPTCFNLFSSDSDSTQTTHLSLGASLPGDTLIVDTSAHQSGVFCWTPLISDTGACPHCFSVNVSDNFCPPGTRSYKYCVTVVDSGFFLNVNNPDSKIFVTVSPNPFSKTATVVLHGSSPLFHPQFILFDALGRTVMNTFMEQNKLIVDGTLLPAGIYFYSIREDDRIMTNGKIIITQ